MLLFGWFALLQFLATLTTSVAVVAALLCHCHDGCLCLRAGGCGHCRRGELFCLAMKCDPLLIKLAHKPGLAGFNQPQVFDGFR